MGLKQKNWNCELRTVKSFLQHQSILIDINLEKFSSFKNMPSQRIIINIQGTYKMGSILFTKLPSFGTKLSIAFVPPTCFSSYLLQCTTISNILISIILFITMTSFFVFIYHILYRFFTWVLYLRLNHLDLEEGRTRPIYGRHRAGLTLSHQPAFYHVIIQYNVQVVNVLQRFMRDEDERRGQRLRAMHKLPPMISYGNHGKRLSCSTECAICLEDFVEGESCQVLPACNHIFHTNCIDHWLTKKLTCPICRNCILWINVFPSLFLVSVIQPRNCINILIGLIWRLNLRPFYTFLILLKSSQANTIGLANYTRKRNSAVLLVLYCKTQLVNPFL